MAKQLEAQKEKSAKMMNVYISVVIACLCMMVFAHAAYLMNMDCLSMSKALTQSLMDITGFKDFSIFPITIQTIYGILAGIGTGIVVFFLLYNEHERFRHYTTDQECGSAKFNDMGKDMDKFCIEYNEPFGKKENDGYSNMICSKSVRISTMFWFTGINANCTVFGSAGTGKSFRIVKPNILQANCSYVVTDPSGELLRSTGSFLKKKKYKIKIFNLSDMKHSNCYNPFDYIRDDAGVMTLVKCLIKNTNPKEAKSGDPFWEKSEEALLSACIYYLKDFTKDKSLRNFSSVMKLLRAGELNEQNPNAKTELDELFDKLPEGCMAWKNYKTFKLAPTKTRMSIMISLGVRLNPFNVEDVANLTRIDTLDLASIGDEKTALFIITPQADQTYMFLASMLYSQLFETLYHKGEHELPPEADNRLPIHVRCILDEIANIGEIPGLPSRMATMRKYNISCTPIWQSLSQMKSRYKDDWEEMLSNSSTLILLGTNEETTAKYFSEIMGKATIRQRNRSLSDGSRKSASKTFQQTSRNLMDPSEIVQMDKDECIVIVTGSKPIRDQKYDATKHKNWPETKNLFNYRDYAVYDTTKNDERDLFIKQMQISSMIDSMHKMTLPKTVGTGGITHEKTDEMAFNTIQPATESQAQTLLVMQTRMIHDAAEEESAQSIIIVNEGPIPTRTLTYLAKRTTDEFKRPCIIFANNITAKQELYGIASVNGNQHLKEVLESTNMLKEPLKEMEGFLELRISKSDYPYFKEEILSQIA